MIYLYDNAIVDDLNQSLGSGDVRVIDPEGAVDIIAQIKDDNIKFPLVVLTRDNDYDIDTSRINFTLSHFGIPASIDLETNKIYNERVLPINLKYNLTVLATNTADMDELMKELIFKYIHMFFLTIHLPYEADRKLRFGISIEPGSTISQSSGSVEYMKTGKLYQSIIPLKCEGCVLVSYMPHQLHHTSMDPELLLITRQEADAFKTTRQKEEMYDENSLQKYRDGH
ncbi:MAG: hypothetical protein NC548_61550 [Lachnospiraceae bacterium]|nr:hypothetical protein [Lachnospiraceae bacterium]MCM1235523.1 hypothetical protein [Ruminococcus flavefaciens]